MSDLDHPFSKGKRGVCIYPVERSATDGYLVPCGKMQSVHEERQQRLRDYNERQQALRASGSLRPSLPGEPTKRRQQRPSF